MKKYLSLNNKAIKNSLNNETLVVIPARSGSKRIKNKNIRIVNGKPLIWWTIKYAKEYFENNDIVISSDSMAIQKIALTEKIEFINRPKKISGDKSNVYLAINHVLNSIKSKTKYKYIVLLQPTSPLRPKNLIKNGIKLLKRNKNFQNLIHLEKTNYHIGSVSKKNEWKSNYKNISRGQEIENQYRPSGCLFIYQIKDFENYNKFLKRKTFGFFESTDFVTDQR